MHISLSSLGSEQNNILLLFAVFFLLVIGLVLVIVSVAFMNEQDETESFTMDNFLNEAIENSRISRPVSSLSDPNQPVYGTFLWKIGLFNIVLNMSFFAALFTLDKRLKPWVSESMCWRLLFCFGGTWTSLYDYKLVSNKMHRYKSMLSALFPLKIAMPTPTYPRTAVQEWYFWVFALSRTLARLLISLYPLLVFVGCLNLDVPSYKIWTTQSTCPCSSVWCVQRCPGRHRGPRDLHLLFSLSFRPCLSCLQLTLIVQDVVLLLSCLAATLSTAHCGARPAQAVPYALAHIA